MNRKNKFLETLQGKINEDAIQALGVRGFQRWRHPKFNKKMKNSDGQAKVTGECGDTMEIYLKFKKKRVSDASYFTTGCASSSVSSSFAAELTIRKTPDEILDITAKKVLDAIGQLPENDLHCASLAARTVQEALSNYMTNQQKRNN
ncbi:MAG: iron-sulfur cluster assembly scaffold protein [Desulfobacula sp.]|nr:iron-sulfur cluster assembly scaffold protein [Desulfobacula sp.]